MRPIDAQAKILEAAGQLDAKLMGEKLREYQRGGLPGASMSDGRGGEPPLPLLGTVDRRIQSARLEYEQSLRHAALALDVCVRLQRHWTVRVDTDAEKAEKLKDEQPGKPCSNVWCDHVCTGIQNDRLRNGRCQPCDQHWRRHGSERDPRPREDSVTSNHRGGSAL